MVCSGERLMRVSHRKTMPACPATVPRRTGWHRISSGTFQVPCNFPCACGCAKNAESESSLRVFVRHAMIQNAFPL